MSIDTKFYKIWSFEIYGYFWIGVLSWVNQLANHSPMIEWSINFEKSCENLRLETISFKKLLKIVLSEYFRYLFFSKDI